MRPGRASNWHMLIYLCTVFVLSGAAGLVYESIWVRYLGLFVGHGAYAQALVLVIFLGGMSAGALAAGQRTERLREPLRWFAYVELAVGLLGLVFHDVFVWTTSLAYATIFPALGPGVAHTIAKWLIAALLIPEVAELRFYDTRDARRRWGVDHRYGAIEIVPAGTASTATASVPAPAAALPAK